MNGNLIGAVNTPTLASATGVWDIEELKLAQQQDTWPLLRQPDPDFEYVSLLLSSETATTNGAQNNTFQDSSTNNFTITRNGNTTQGSFSPYLPNWSNYFDGSGDLLLTASSPAILSGDFTIEGWVYVTSLAVSRSLVCIGDDFNATGALFFISTLGRLGIFGNNSAILTGTSQTVGINSWNHIAFVRSSGTIKAYLNGIADSTTVTNSTAFTGINRIGGELYNTGLGGTVMLGYISDYRLVNGTAVYTSNFTPPTAPLTAISGTSLLTCQSNRFIDNSTNNFTITRNGDTRITPFSPFSSFAATKGYVPATYGGSAYFDGTGDYLTTVANAAFAFAKSDFTVEMWIYPTVSITSPANIGLFYIEQTNGLVVGLSNGYLAVGSRAVSYSITSTYIPPVNTWTHVAVTRSGATAWIFANGTQVGTVTASGGDPNNNADYVCTTGLPTIAGNYAGGAGFGYFPGCISNIRVIKGTAVYTSNFTPPTSPLTAISNTQLLTNFTNGGIIDSAALNVAETVGNAQVSTSVKKYGSGSYYFDGTGDGIFIPSSTTLARGAGSFTIEFWYHPTSTAGTNPNIMTNNNGSGSFVSGLWSFHAPHSSYPNKYSLWVGSFSTSSPLLVSSSNISTNVWTHIAITRSSNTWRLFINGTIEATGTHSGVLDNGGSYPQFIGYQPNVESGRYITGYISDLRMTNGLARYITNFTPPTAVLPTF